MLARDGMFKYGSRPVSTRRLLAAARGRSVGPLQRRAPAGVARGVSRAESRANRRLTNMVGVQSAVTSPGGAAARASYWRRGGHRAISAVSAAVSFGGALDALDLDDVGGRRGPVDGPEHLELGALGVDAP